MIKGGYSEKVRNGDIPRMDQPLVSKCPKQDGEEVTDNSQQGPEKIDIFKELIEIVQWDLGEKQEEDPDRN